MRSRWYIVATTILMAGVVATALAMDVPHTRDTGAFPDPVDDPFANEGHCGACHSIHKATGGELWAKGTTVNELCKTCHNDTELAPKPGMEMMTHQAQRAKADCDFCAYNFEVTCTSCHDPHGHQQAYKQYPTSPVGMFLRTRVKLWKTGCLDSECGWGEHHDDADKLPCVPDETCAPDTCSGLQTCQLKPTGDETICVCPIGGDGACAGCLDSVGVAKFEPSGNACAGTACGAPNDACGYGTCITECSTVDPACSGYHADLADPITPPKDWNEGECITATPTCTENAPAGGGLHDIACWGGNFSCQSTDHDAEYYCDCPVGGAGVDCKSGAGADGCAPGFAWDGSECVNYTCVAGDEAGGGTLCGYGANCDMTSVCQADLCADYWDETLSTPACAAWDSNPATRVLEGSCATNPCPAGALACTTVEGGNGHICECPVGSDPGTADCGLALPNLCATGFKWDGGAEQCVPDCDGAVEGADCGYGGGCTGACPTVAQTCAGGQYYDDTVGGCVTNETCAVGVNCFNGGSCDKAPFDDEYVCNCPPGTTGADCAGGTATEGLGCDTSRAYVHSGGACVVDCEAAGKADTDPCGFGGQCKGGGGGGPSEQRPTTASGTGSDLALAYDGSTGTSATFASSGAQNGLWSNFTDPGCTGPVTAATVTVVWSASGDFGKGKTGTDFMIGSSLGNLFPSPQKTAGSGTATLDAYVGGTGPITDCSQIPALTVDITWSSANATATASIAEVYVAVDQAGGGGLTCSDDYDGDLTPNCDPGYTGTACDACNGTTHFDYGNRACESTDPATTCGGCGTGSCWDDGGVGVCDCPDTFTGADCSVCGETPTLSCQKSYGDGLCLEGYDGASCAACASGYIATPEGLCVLDTGGNGPLACSTDPCFNGSQGTCARAADGTAMCVCNDKWDGGDCNTCTASDDTYFCNKDKGTAGCDTGYQDDGFGGICNACAPTYHRDADGVCRKDDLSDDPCEPNPCLNGGTCYVVDNGGTGYMCDCPGRYTGDTCQNETGCAAGTTCDCDTGYIDGVGVCDACDTANDYVQAPDGTCVLNPCRDGADPCQNGSKCYVGPGGTAACDCTGQYYGTGGNCESCDLAATVTFQDYTGPSAPADLGPGGGTGLCEVCHTATTHFQAAAHPVHPSTITEGSKDPAERHSAAGSELLGKDCVGCHIHKLSNATDPEAQGYFGFVPIAGASTAWRNGPETFTSPSSCDGCHLATTGVGTQDVDSYKWGNDKSMIDGDEWTAYGHGVAHGATFPSGNTYAAMDGGSPAAFSGQHDNGCEYCHDSTVPHNHPENYFRLRNFDALQRGVCGAGGTDLCFDGVTDCSSGGDAACAANKGEPANDVCNVCHLTGGNGYDPDNDSVPPGTWAKITSSLLVDAGSKDPARHFGGKHGTGGKGGRFCWDCHDPHGDLSADDANPNFYMIQRRPTIDHASLDAFGRPFDLDDDDVSFPATVVGDVEGLAAPVKFDPDGGLITTDTCDIGGTNECVGAPAGRPCTNDAQCNWDLEDYDNETFGAEGDRALCRQCHLNTEKNCADQTSGPCSANAHPEGDGTGGAIAPGCVQQCHPHDLQFKGQASAEQNCYTCHAKGKDADLPDYKIGPTALISIDEYGGESSAGGLVDDVGSGHGRTGAPYLSGNPAAAFTSTGGPDSVGGGCYYCHTTDATKTHPTDNPYALNNPFMLATNECCNPPTCTVFGLCGGNGNVIAGAAGDTNYICLRCHSTDVSNPGVDPPPDAQLNDAPPRCTTVDECVLMDTTTKAHTHGNGGPNGVRCWHCHDPHGDGAPPDGNTYMIQLNAFNNLAPDDSDPCNAALGQGCPDEVPIDIEGNPLTGDTRGLTNAITFTANATPTRSDYMSGAGALCGECHPATVDYCNQTDCTTDHQSTKGACTNCHKHTNDFQGEGTCITCHGVETGDVLDYSPMGTRAMIDMIEWRNTGHGLMSGTYDSGRTAAAFDGSEGVPADGDTESAGCYYCHVENFDVDPDGAGPLEPHPTSTTYAWNNPFLLRGAAGNDVCNACHATGGGGVDPAADFQGHDASMRCDGGEKTATRCIEVGTAHNHGLSETGKKCWHCHDPHGDGNDYMIQLNAFSNLAPDDSDPCDPALAAGCPGEVPIDVNPGDGATNGLTLPITFQPNGVPSSAAQYTVAGAELCARCHQTGATAKCNQTDCSEAPSGSHAGTSPCTQCHSHSGDFAGEGDCIGCHNGEVEIKGGLRIGGMRRGVGTDFQDNAGWQSHHVRMLGGSSLTVHDCVMCHAEGYSNGYCVIGPNTCSIDSSVGCEVDADCVAFNTTKHKNRIIDLRNVDSTTPHNSATDASLVEGTDYFAYNKDSIDPTAPPWVVTKNGPWSSANPTWVTQTSTKLDPFCLTCHDADGAAGQAQMGELGATADPLDPFNDTMGGTFPGNITNYTDQQPRGNDRVCTGGVCDFDGVTSCTPDTWGNDDKRCGPMTPAVVDVASAVTTESARVTLNKATGAVSGKMCIKHVMNDDSPFTDSSTPTQEWRCAANTSVGCTPNEFGEDPVNCASWDFSPRNGYYARHAIRGQSASIYTDYQYCGPYDTGPCSRGTAMPTASARNSEGPQRSIWLATAADDNATPRFVDTGNAPDGTPEWNDTSVMSCADCHTTDGANQVDGNAHGAKSEYLLKDRYRGAEEGLADGGSGTGNIICYQCHDGTATYVVGNAANHAHGNTLFDAGGAKPDPTTLYGSARASETVGTIFGIACTQCHGGTDYGSIHGSSENIGSGIGGAATDRGAYRFMNGAGMRYYSADTDNVANWQNIGTNACYTVASTDTFGGCVVHGGKGPGRTVTYSRPLQY